MSILTYYLKLLFTPEPIAPIVIVIFGGLMFWAGHEEKGKHEDITVKRTEHQEP